MSTINDVSRLTKVFKATVSRVLSDSRGVKGASRQVMLQAVEALSYRSNMIAQSLFSQSIGCTSVIYAQDNINQTTSYPYALEKQPSQYQEYLLLRFANTSNGVMSPLEELTYGLCDNMLIVSARFPLNINRPDMVLVDCLDSEGNNSTQSDHAFATKTACHYLISQGRRQITLIYPQSSGFADQVLLGYKYALEKNFLSLNRNLALLDSTSPSVVVQELVNNAMAPNFDALLVSDEQQTQRVVPQLQASSRAALQNVMVFSLAGSLQLSSIPTIPAIEYSTDVMASWIVNWLTEKADSPDGSPLHGDLIIPKH